MLHERVFFQTTAKKTQSSRQAVARDANWNTYKHPSLSPVT